MALEISAREQNMFVTKKPFSSACLAVAAEYVHLPKYCLKFRKDLTMPSEPG